MRSFLFLGLGSVLLACSSGSEPVHIGQAGSTQSISLLEVLCVEACAHVHKQNCFAMPAIDVNDCFGECQQAASEANTACTDERAALYACIAKATITCEGDLADTPKVNGCDAEDSAITECDAPGSSCTRSPASDDFCFQFGLSKFFQCSNGQQLDPPCTQVTSSAFCCP